MTDNLHITVIFVFPSGHEGRAGEGGGGGGGGEWRADMQEVHCMQVIMF